MDSLGNFKFSNFLSTFLLSYVKIGKFQMLVDINVFHHKSQYLCNSVKVLFKDHEESAYATARDKPQIICNV